MKQILFLLFSTLLSITYSQGIEPIEKTSFNISSKKTTLNDRYNSSLFKRSYITDNPSKNTSIDDSLPSKGKFYTGLYFTGNISLFDTRIHEFTTENGQNYDENSLIGIGAGLMFYIPLTRFLAVEPNVSIASKGSQYVRKDFNLTQLTANGSQYADIYQNFVLTYIETPIFLNINFNEIGKSNTPISKSFFVVGTGIAPSFNIGSKVRYNYFVQQQGNSVFYDEKTKSEKFDHANKLLLSYIGQVSVHINNFAFITVRASKSINNVYNKDELDSYNMKTKIATFSCSFGLTI